ncbi:MAG: twin-arginine translocation signal domain-containing protein [Chloroflexi bacterium]|nr:MAG: twin-arginine translocation signal domain-containing protein [Chloroflexota bacterium]
MAENVKTPDVKTETGILNETVTRRDFIKTSAFVGGTAALAGGISWAQNGPDHGGAFIADSASAAGTYPLNKPEHIIYTVCLNCHTACNIKAKIQDGLLVKVDGNPYSPQNLLPHLPEDTPPAEAAKVDGNVCPKGQSGVQIANDPYRLRKVLKRVGPRGSGKWQTIDFNQAVDEIVNGGNLFGEGDVEGLDAIYKLRDPELAKELGADASAVAAGDMTLDEFKSKHAAHLDMLIDPDHPDAGPVNNQFIFQGGRIEHGRKELAKRFTYDGFGSVNFYLHTTICEQSHHIAYDEMTGGKKHHLKPDSLHSEFIIYFGTGAFEANFGPTNMTAKVTSNMVNDGLKIAVVDPRFSKTASKAWKWIPINPGADAALAMGMVRWIIENERYDETYLTNPNNDAANLDDETNSTDATHLVRTDDMVLLTPADAGLEGEDSYVVLQDGTPALSATAESGDLFVDTTVNGIPVKSVFQLLKERAEEYTLEEYAAIAGVKVDDIVALADEFTSHGKKAAAEMYRGPVQHTNGYYNGTAIITLNLLIGNPDWKGGLSAGGGHWHEDGSKPGAPFPKAVVAAAPGGMKKFGIHINRESASYEKTTYFEGYPAKRPWYPFTKELYQNIIPSATAGYPYKAKALFINKGTPVLASPAGHKQIEMLRDPKNIPLFIACDVTVGETSMYADYIFPDLSYLERWGMSHTTPDVNSKYSKVRQPAAPPVTEIVTVDGEEMPASMEAFLIAVGKKLGLAGFGKDGLGEGYNFDRPEQFYLAEAANLAFGDKEDGSETLPAADEEEMRIFREARAHLPKAVFDEEVWKAAVPADLWPSVVYLLNRGARTEPASKAVKGDKIGHTSKLNWHFFVNKVGKAKNSMTGERFSPLPLVEPVKDAGGNEIKDDGFDLNLITYKEVTGGQSRTIASPWLHGAILPENYVLMNASDARRLSLQDGDYVRVVSASNTDGKVQINDAREYNVVGKVRVTEGMRPGVIAASWSYGHWAYGSHDVEVDGQVVKGEARRARGIVPNPAMRIDPVLGDVCLTDPIGGSASFFDTKVKVEKVAGPMNGQMA